MQRFASSFAPGRVATSSKTKEMGDEERMEEACREVFAAGSEVEVVGDLAVL